METGQVVRRLVHISTPVFLIYYFLPDPLWMGGPTRVLGLLILLAIVLVSEVLRLVYRPKIIGMRDYEQFNISAGAWAAIAMTFTFLFFPIGFAAPALMGMAWVDPVIGDLRKKRSPLYPSLPLVLYFVIALGSMAMILGPSIGVVLAAILATPLAILAERWKSRYVDDDFLMIVIPLLAIAGVLVLLP